MIDNSKQHLNDLIFLSSELASVKDFDVLMEKILKSARDFVHCDAGSIYIKEDDQLVFPERYSSKTRTG